MVLFLLLFLQCLAGGEHIHDCASEERRRQKAGSTVLWTSVNW